MSDMRHVLTIALLMAAACQKESTDDGAAGKQTPAASAAELVGRSDPEACKQPEVQLRILSEMAPRTLEPFGIVTADDLEAARAQVGDPRLGEIKALGADVKSGNVRCSVRVTGADDYGVHAYSLQRLGEGVPGFSLRPGAFVVPMFKHRAHIVQRALEMAQRRSPLPATPPSIDESPQAQAPPIERAAPTRSESEANVPSGDPLAPLGTNEMSVPRPPEI